MSPPSIAWRKDYLLGYPVRRAPSGLGEGSSPLYGKANVFSTRYSLGERRVQRFFRRVTLDALEIIRQYGRI